MSENNDVADGLQELYLEDGGAVPPPAGADAIGAPPPPHHHVAGHAPSLQLPTFWTDTPSAWFGLAESRFRMRNITNEWDRFDVVVSSLPKDTLRLVLSAVTDPDEHVPYTAIKARLLATHVRTDYQRIEQLLLMDGLGDRRPSELLAHMLENCPTGEDKTKFFAFFFLHRLPQELRIMLGEDDHADVHAVAAKADRLWALHGHRQHGAIAAVDLDNVNAVRGAASGSKRGAARGRGRGAPAAAAAAAAHNPAPSALARESSGLCFFHWGWGDKAKKCEAPCSWQGN
jgi:hypothetical protein